MWHTDSNDTTFVLVGPLWPRMPGETVVSLFIVPSQWTGSAVSEGQVVFSVLFIGLHNPANEFSCMQHGWRYMAWAGRGSRSSVADTIKDCKATYFSKKNVPIWMNRLIHSNSGNRKVECKSMVKSENASLQSGWHKAVPVCQLAYQFTDVQTSRPVRRLVRSTCWIAAKC